jgi:hypothetical protein
MIGLGHSGRRSIRHIEEDTKMEEAKGRLDMLNSPARRVAGVAVVAAVAVVKS